MRVGARVMGSVRRVTAVTTKELRQLARDGLTLGMIVGIPTIQLVLFGYAIELDVRHVPTLVLDRAHSALSRKLAAELEATQTFRFVGRVRSEAEMTKELEGGRIGAVVYFPPDLDRRWYRGHGAEIAVLVDATNPTVAAAVTKAAGALGERLAARVRPFVTQARDPPPPRIPPRDRATFGVVPDVVRGGPIRIAAIPFYNPEGRTPVFIVPGLIGVILTMTMMLMTALAVVRERERGTFEFLIATPVRRSEVMVGKILPYLGVGVLQVGLVLTLGVVLFDVPIHGSLLDLGVGAVAFIAGMLAMGLVISSIAQTQFQATQLAFFFFLPSMLLSGFMFPFEAMPQPAQWVGSILPLTHFLRIVRGILLKGASLESLLGEVQAIVAFTAAALTLAVLTFRRRLA